MPSSTRPAAPGPSTALHTSKRTMSDTESVPQDTKKARRNASVSSRDAKRRRRKKKKAPIVSAGTARDVDETAQARSESSSRAPLSVRNDIIRFTSAPPESDLQASTISDSMDAFRALSPKQSSERKASSLRIGEGSLCQREATPSIPKDNKCAVPTDGLIHDLSSGSLEDKVAQLEGELKYKNSLIASHHALLGQIQQAVTCQVCLDLMYKPYALAPCGHTACYSCLVNWFTAPPPDNGPAPPVMLRRKTCPHCRAIIRERPVEVWGVKSIAQAVGKSGLLPNQLSTPAEVSEGHGANGDTWKDIFPKSGLPSRPGAPWFFPGVDVDVDDIHIADGAPRGDVGMLDMEDGGIYRCLDCMHEIWDGICTNCGRVYPGHGPEGDDEDHEENAMGWLENQMGAEEVDVADDPGWMGLEDGEADDVGDDIDDWHPFDPWGHQFRMFRGPWGFLGTIHVDEEDEEDEDEMSGRADYLVPIIDGDYESEGEDEGYESSFIDDDDDRGGIGGVFDGPRFYEIGDVDENEDHRAVDPVSDDYEDEGSDAGSRRAVHVLSDED